MAEFEYKKKITEQKISKEQIKKVSVFTSDIIRKNIDAKDIIFLSIIVIFTFLYGIGIPIVGKQITNNAQLLISDKQNVILKFLVILIVTRLLIEMFLKFITLIQYVISQKIQKKMEIAIKELVLNKMNTVKISYFDNPEFKDEQLFINTNVANKVTTIIPALMKLIVSLCLVVSTIIIISSYKLSISFIAVLTIIPIGVISYKSKNHIYMDTYWEIPEYKHMNLAYALLTDSQYSTEKAIYKYDEYVEDIFDDSLEEIKKKRNKAIKLIIVNNMGINVFTYLIISLILCWVGYEAYMSVIRLGTFTLMAVSIENFFFYSKNLTNSMSDIIAYVKYTNHILVLEDLEDEEEDSIRLSEDKQDLIFKDVHFTYPSTKKEVLKGVSFEIKKGEKVAIVGKNGSGKSTIISLLTALYSPTAGQILYGNQDIQCCRNQLRNKTSCVFQKFNKYDMSIKDNILIGDINRKITDEELTEVCEKVGVNKFVNKFDDGINSILGSMGANGVNLSGGQWEKVVMARVLIKKDASILIMDEPTAALDPKAETDFYEQFSQISEDKTSIVVSHRLGITRLVDKIIVLSEGRMVECGSFKQLMAQKGYFFDLFNSQAAWYQ